MVSCVHYIWDVLVICENGPYRMCGQRRPRSGCAMAVGCASIGLSLSACRIIGYCRLIGLRAHGLCLHTSARLCLHDTTCNRAPRLIYKANVSTFQDVKYTDQPIDVIIWLSCFWHVLIYELNSPNNSSERQCNWNVAFWCIWWGGVGGGVAKQSIPSSKYIYYLYRLYETVNLV